MKWPATHALADLYERWTGHQTDPQRVAHRLEEIRTTMSDMLGQDGAQRYPEVVRRIEAGRDAQALWYARADLMAALAGLHGEQAASARMASLTALFDGMLPKGMISRPTSLHSSQ